MTQPGIREGFLEEEKSELKSNKERAGRGRQG